MHEPLVSIVVLNWNGERVIRSSLDSLRKLDYLNKEVIVVDSGSTDSSVDIIRREYPELSLIRMTKNVGFSAGMNVGMRQAHGDLILLYNNDAIAHSGSLSRMVKTALSSDCIGMVGPLILYYEPNDIIWSSGGKLDLATGTIWSQDLGKQIQSGLCKQRSPEADIDFLSGCVLLVKKGVVEAIGPLDEESLVGGQDVDWCLKARRSGFACALDPEAIVWHIGSYSSRQMPLRSYAERLRSDLRVILLHFPARALVPSLVFQLLVAPLSELLFLGQAEISFRSRVTARLAGFRENLRNPSVLLSMRKQIARLGKVSLRVRTMELVRFTVFRMRSKEFYMGKFLKKTE